MNINDKLSEVFDVPSITKTTEVDVIDNDTGEIIQSDEQRIENDYDKSRSNLHELLLKGQEALNHALEVAKQSEHPRAFEVVGNLMKQLADVNQQLMDLHQQKQKLDEPNKAEKAKQVTNNNAIFVGSTAELNKLIKNMAKGE
jgi:predicted house-cleaning noncanonical NTP pyrophosphatase (MazG superfamily)